MENQEVVSQNGLPCESAPIFNQMSSLQTPKPLISDGKDKIFALIYLLLGYGLVYTFSSFPYFSRNIALYTIAYVSGVLAYVFVRSQKPAKESFFWLVILLGVGIPYGFWSVMQFVQILALIAVAAYWTLSVTGVLLKDNKSSEWIMADLWNAFIIIPLYNFNCQFRVLKSTIQNSRSGNKLISACLGLCIAIPVLAVILPLLSRADSGFKQLLIESGYYFYRHLFANILRFVLSLPISAYMFGLIYGCLRRRNTDHFQMEIISKTMQKTHCIANTAIHTAIILVCISYGLFIGLQSSYLFSAFAGIRPEYFTYAEYARQGFFELCIISAINVLIILGANTFIKTQKNQNRILRWINVTLSVLTLLLIATAMSKMFLYISVYGLTVKRILTSVFMVWMTILFLLTIIWQWKRIAIIRFAIIAGAILFCILCVLPVQQYITAFNML